MVQDVILTEPANEPMTDNKVQLNSKNIKQDWHYRERLSGAMTSLSQNMVFFRIPAVSRH